jgi:hypothetical protein
MHLTLSASWPPTRSGELSNCKHPDYRPVYAEPAIRLARSVRTRSVAWAMSITKAVGLAMPSPPTAGALS